MVISIDEVINIKRSVESELMKIPGVNGVGAGYKEVGGETTHRLGIRVYVNKKRDNVPDIEKIPSEILGVETDIIERAEIAKPHSKDESPYPILMGGISIHRGREEGTIGAIVRDSTQTKEVMILSSYHILACVDPNDPNGPIYQGNPGNKIARYTRGNLTDTVDAAVACIDQNIYSSGKIKGLSDNGMDIAVAGAEFAVTYFKIMHDKGRQADVIKRGITTRVTHGYIKDVEAPVGFNYQQSLGVADTHWFGHQLLIEPYDGQPFSQGGDSGSAILDNSGHIVGLLVGGVEGQIDSYANRIENVLDVCQITPYTDGDSAIVNVNPC